jgi:hypothetical protein
VGDVMRLATLALLLAALGAASSWAQAVPRPARSVQDEITSTLMGLPYDVAGIVAIIVAARKCRPDAEVRWMRVIDAIDRRYWHCVSEEPRWREAISRQFGKEEQAARAAGTSAGLGALSLAFFWSTAARQLEQKAATLCANFDSSFDPASVSDEARAAYLRSVPQSTPESLETVLTRLREFLALADDTAWVQSPCNRFWPDYGAKK